MAPQRIGADDTLHAITDRWPQTVDLFVAQGFPQVADAAMRESFGKQITLRQALAVKNLDLDAFLKQLEGVIGEELPGEVSTESGKPLEVAGLLPCPVRIPMQESLDAFLESYRQETGVEVKYELQAASVGTAWMDEHVTGLTSAEGLPDLFISAGFETFFDPNGIGRFREEFFDGLPFEEFNRSFEGVDLRDPGRHYSIISVVPAVFLVNTAQLGDLPIPRSWEELLDPRFEKRISLPVGDFDLFSGILLDIHKRFGDEGVRKLGRGLQQSMHPAQMVKIGKAPKPPMVTIMPYFFTKMAKAGGPMHAVWPEDGAIISPIFLLAKRNKRERLQPLIDHFASRELGEILAHKGLFPVTNPDVDNRLEEGNRFLWLGWDYIKSRDITALIKHCEAVFEEGGNS